jgi:enolase
MSISIVKIQGLEVLDSRGNPTVEALVSLSDGTFASAISPSGASTGTKEACELRDGDKSRYLGKGVLQAVKNINQTINKGLCGVSPFDQFEIDTLLKKLDGSENKSNLGANAILAVSLAVAKAAAISQKKPFFEYINDFASNCNQFTSFAKQGKGGVDSGGILTNTGYTLPMPMMNILNGGKHADNGLAIQEFMIIPSSAKTIEEAVRMGAEVFHNLKKILTQNSLNTGVGDEGGFAPQINKTEDSINYILNAITLSGYKVGTDINLALDCAASEFFNEGKYSIDEKSLSTSELVVYYENLVSKFPIISIEDPFSEHDEDGFKLITQKIGNKVQIVGDDIFCTNPKILSYGITNKIANALLVKPNQIGTLTETIQAVDMAKKAGYKTVLSHRSGESEDTSIAHIAVALNAGQIKTGSLSRTDRTAKYNELIRIAGLINS